MSKDQSAEIKPTVITEGSGDLGRSIEERNDRTADSCKPFGKIILETRTLSFCRYVFLVNLICKDVDFVIFSQAQDLLCILI